MPVFKLAEKLLLLSLMLFSMEALHMAHCAEACIFIITMKKEVNTYGINFFIINQV